MGTMCLRWRNQTKPACPRGWNGLGEAVPQPSSWVLAKFGRMARSPSSGDGQRELALKVRVKVAPEKETARCPTSALQSLKVRLIHTGFHGHIGSCHLASKECGNLPVVLGLVSLGYSQGLAARLTCKRRSLLWQGLSYPDRQRLPESLRRECIGLTVPMLDST